MKSDIEIAQSASYESIINIASKLGINESELKQYGNKIAKVTSGGGNKNAKVILVTSINPTKSGEGKSTTTVGLVDGLNAIGKQTIGCLREPSLGPVFGLKGGACGGGYAQVIPMEDINLHFTGDMHAITTANNLISACIDNHIHHGNELDIDINNILFKRVMDMNDRNLRQIEVGLGSKFNGVERIDGFDITVASEIMAVLCLASDLDDFGKRVDNIVIAKNNTGDVIFLKELNITGSLKTIMKDAISPNLVQTLEHSPVFIHGGPFANIAHGCNSVIATKMAKSYGEFVVTEAGFGADLGFEKFIDIKARTSGITPDCVVIVATLRALKFHAGVEYEKLDEEDVEAVKVGCENLKHHIQTVKKSGINVVIAINKFASDTDAEVNALIGMLPNDSVSVVTSFVDGSKGAVDLANKVVEASSQSNELKYFYDKTDNIEVKLNKLIKNVYNGSGFILTESAKSDLEFIEKNNWTNLPLCMAKTPNSLSGDPKLLNVPSGFKLEIKSLKPKLGAGFIVCQVGNVMTMPGLAKVPNATKININEDGVISGLS